MRHDVELDQGEVTGILQAVPPPQEYLEQSRPHTARFKISSEAGFYKWLDWLDKMALCDQTADKGGWAFRGQADARWEIKSCFERSVTEALQEKGRNATEEDLLAVERMMIAKFRGQCGGAFDIDKKDMLGWLSTMQHYGVPTRLVDFTFSPLVALYMAMRGRGPSANFSVWAVYRASYETVYSSRMSWLFSDSKCENELCSCKELGGTLSRKGVSLSNLEKGDRSNWECANCFLVNGKCKSKERERNFPMMLWIKPELTNARMQKQGGVFMMPTFLRKTAMQQLFWNPQTRDDGFSEGKIFLKSRYALKSQIDDVVRTARLIQFVFSNNLVEFVLRFLTRANVRGSLLFPDVQGVAEELCDVISGDMLKF